MRQWDHGPCYRHMQPSFRLMADDDDDDAGRYAGMSKNQSWISAFLSWTEISALLSVGLLFFLLLLNWKLAVDSVAAHLAGGCLVSAFFVLPLLLGGFGVTRSLSRGWALQACLVQEAPFAGNGCFIVARMPESCLRFRREFYSRVPRLNESFSSAAGPFITSAVGCWSNWRQRRAETENSWF